MSQTSRFIHIDSRLRINNNNSQTNNYNIQITPALQKIKHCKLVALNLPILHYNVTESNNRFIIVDIISVRYDVILTPGSYDVFTFIQELESKFISSGFPEPVIVTYDAKTFRLSFTTVANSFVFSFNNDNSAYKLLGFPQESLTLPYRTTIIAPYAMDLSLPPCFFIRVSHLPVNIISCNNIEGTFCVYITNNSSYINYHFQNTHYDMNSCYGVHNLNNINIQLIDPINGELFDIQNSEWSMLWEVYY